MIGEKHLYLQMFYERSIIRWMQIDGGNFIGGEICGNYMLCCRPFSRR